MMGQNGKRKKHVISTWVDSTLAAAVRQEAADKAVSMSVILRWALMDRYERQLAQVRAGSDEPVSEADVVELVERYRQQQARAGSDEPVSEADTVGV